jgi:hypothetical protein
MRKSSALPQNLPPRLIGLEAAADYLDLSTSKFAALVKAGRAPSPRRMDGRRLFDVRDLDRFADSLPYEGAAPGDETWADVDAT